MKESTADETPTPTTLDDDATPTTTSEAQSKKESDSSSNSWGLYNFLVLFRLAVAPFLLGYIHPDEFFQGGQELWFGCPPNVPWEFQSDHALRSVVPPSFLTLRPLQTWSFLFEMPVENFSGWHVWIIPRVACAAFSLLTVDYSVWSLCTMVSNNTADSDDKKKRAASTVPGPVLLVASAWPTVVFLSRPFTNTLETCILGLLLQVAFYHGGRPTKGSKFNSSLLQCFVFGALVAFGIFTRFTFVCFAIPVIVYFFYFRIMRSGGIWGWLLLPGATIATFLFVALQIMEVDTEFYSPSQGVKSQEWFLTPWNAFSYNSQSENLQQHGLHPRWTHALVNMFLMFGPLSLLGYFVLTRSTHWIIGSNLSEGKRWMEDRTYASIVVCKAILISGLVLLSIAPHQEPRFLLPLLIPLVVLSDNPLTRSPPTNLVPIWVLFNFVLLLIFGVAHQGGVVPSLLAISSASKSLERPSPLAVVYYHTYTPPTFLTRTTSSLRTLETCDGMSTDQTCPNSSPACGVIPILDLDGSQDLSSLKAVLKEHLSCPRSANDAAPSVHLVTTPLFQIVDGEQWYLGSQTPCLIPGYKCEKIWSHSPHLSTENMPSIHTILREGLSLNTYEITCQSVYQELHNAE